MDRLKKLGAHLLDIVEVYCPMISLIVMFSSFLIQVISRYVFKAQFDWTYEMTLIGFLWCLLLSAPYAQRKNAHVKFDIIYNLVSDKWKFIFRCISNLYLIFCFALVTWYGADWVSFMKIQKSSMLRIPLNIIYAPFVLFAFLTLAHTVYNLIVDVRNFMRSGGKE